MSQSRNSNQNDSNENDINENDINETAIMNRIKMVPFENKWEDETERIVLNLSRPIVLNLSRPFHDDNSLLFL